MKNFLIMWLVVLVSFLPVFAQGTVDQRGVYRPTEEEMARNKRLAQMLRHPTFITLRLVSTPREVPRDHSSDTPKPYRVKDPIRFELFVAQNSSEVLRLANTRPYYDYRTELIRDGEPVAYSATAREGVKRAETNPHSGSVFSISVPPGEEKRLNIVSLDDWYDPLAPGRYQLTVRKRFAWDGEWVESNPVNFDVIPRKQAAPIPDCVSVRLTPEGSKPSLESRPYRLAYHQSVAVELINDCDRPMEVSVVDRYYGHRLQLFKDEKLIPYSAETARLIESKDKDPRLVEVFTSFFLDPKTTSRLGGFSLSQWYSPLPPGIYRLTDRRRFEIEGPWTKDSEVFVFEVVP